ncbi:MAG: M48 family metallopeptidase [Candidatus Cloacimonetes bacterium]|nr:M48 family metallopeptidase [Candidatus Cloacimonadota bacterium]MCF7861570.1 M48 family metallopeptidase [Candidatus Woesearchaeota archaeon]
METILVSDLSIDVIRKDIKNIHLTVYPPNGRIKVSVPIHVDNDSLRLFIISKMTWIKKKLKELENQDRQSFRRFVSGENHYFWGKRHILNVIYQKAPLPNKVVIRNKKYIDLFVRENSNLAIRKNALYSWYRSELKNAIPPLIKKWENKLNISVSDWGVKIMKTKWGTCNANAKRIWLNLELIKKPRHCLDYIVLHEIIHILERTHSDRFNELMDEYYPNWRTVRKELNEFIL